MKILAFDSTAKAASVAVCEGEKLLALFSVDNGLTQSELLLPMIEDALSVLKLSFSDIDVIATSVGPGSFTGVRIGVSLAKGIAFSKKLPCVAVSTLEAIAENLRPLDGIYIAAMDARRDQLYTATFENNGDVITRLCDDRAISIAELAEEIKTYKDKRIYAAGDGYDALISGLKKHGIEILKTPPQLINESAYSVALVAKRKFEAGEYTCDSELSPTYLRLPQAERERLMKEK